MCQALGQANQRWTNGQGGKPLNNILEQTVDDSYGPMAARFLLSCVRVACQEEARRPELQPLPENFKDLAEKVRHHALRLMDRAGDDLPRRAEGFLAWLDREEGEDSAALFKSIDKLFRHIWMRSLMIESAPLDCPVNR